SGKDDIRRLTLTDLRTRLREHGLSVTGNKQTLIERLQATQPETPQKAATPTTTTVSHLLRQKLTQQQQLVNINSPSFAKNTEQSPDNAWARNIRMLEVRYREAKARRSLWSSTCIRPGADEHPNQHGRHQQ
ncbi:uncharacterized protein Dwil_GK26860, partial [Drosophila willistoni]